MLTEPGATNAPFDLAGRRVWVAGHRGMVGSAVVRRLADTGCHLQTADRAALDLRDQMAVNDWMAFHRPEVVVLAAARVGGIQANATRPADFLYDNLAIQTNVIHASYRLGVRKLLFLGSSCIYPGRAPQPMGEDALLTGPLEPTNEAYAIAKIAGLKMATAYRRQYGCDFISAMPTNLYGPGDNFDLEASHVIPALMRKAYEAKASGGALEVWGTGTPRREFLHVDDLADACVYLLNRYSADDPINVGTGEDIAIGDLAAMIAEIAGVGAGLRFRSDKPDGAPRKLLDVGRLTALGWRARTPLREGLAETYRWFETHHDSARLRVG